MPALARGDEGRLLRSVAEAESFGGDHPFEGEFLTQLGRLVPAEWISYSDCHGCGRDDPGHRFDRPGDVGFYSGIDWAAVMPVLEAEYPILQQFRQQFRQVGFRRAQDLGLLQQARALPHTDVQIPLRAVRSQGQS